MSNVKVERVCVVKWGEGKWNEFHEIKWHVVGAQGSRCVAFQCILVSIEFKAQGSY
jgi:hypothetical protein